MANASDALVWSIVNKSNAFVVRRNGAAFSREPGNLRNQHSFKFSGLANARTVDVSLRGGAPALRIRKTRGQSKHSPKHMFSTYGLSVHMAEGTCRSAETIKKATRKSHYRGDLTKYAVARYHALYRSTKVKGSAIQKKGRKRRGAAARK